MNKLERIKTVFLYGIFIFYIFLLIQILFLTRVSISELFNSQRAFSRSVNLIPFYSIRSYISGGTIILRAFAFSNVVGNIIIFIPLGIYLSLFKKDKRVIANLTFAFIISLFVELTQWFLGIGVADIDDIILNCLGALVGILGYKFLLLILKSEKKVSSIVTLLSTSVGLVIFCLSFMIKLRL